MLKDNFAPKNNLQFFLDLSGPTLYKEITCGMFTHSEETMFVRKYPMQCCIYHFEQHCIGILFSQCFPNSNVDPERTDILSKENRLFHICLVACFFKSGTISRNNIGSFWSMLTPEFIYSFSTTMDRSWHWLEHQQNVSKNVMRRQVVPNTDKSCQEDFSEGFF